MQEDQQGASLDAFPTQLYSIVKVCSLSEIWVNCETVGLSM